MLKNYPWEASLGESGIKLSNSWLLKEMRKSNSMVLQFFQSLNVVLIFNKKFGLVIYHYDNLYKSTVQKFISTKPVARLP